MNWWKVAKQEKGVEQVIKDRLRSSPFFVALFNKHDVGMDDLDDLSISVDDLDDAHCMTGDDQLIVDDPLVESKDIFKSKFHYIAHEVLHWLKGKSVGNTENVEKDDYFADPEEVESFATAMAYYIYENEGTDGLEDEFLPLIKITIGDDAAARKFFADRETEAKELLSELSLCNYS